MERRVPIIINVTNDTKMLERAFKIALICPLEGFDGPVTGRKWVLSNV
jgi:hypothetical protein